jgi:phosphoglycerate dehydrogenase-like enzyme
MGDRSIVVVQGAESAEQVPGIAAIASEAELRFAASAPALAEALPGADVLLGWDFSQAGLSDVWAHADALRWIHWAGAGVDAVLFPELVKSEVVLTNSRGIFDRAMAEFVLGYILSFAKTFPQITRDQDERRWSHRLGEMIIDRRVLVVGVGSIGRAIATLLSRAGMHVEGIGRRARDGDDDFSAIHGQEDLNAVLPDADYVVIIVPLTAETRGMFGASTSPVAP